MMCETKFGGNDEQPTGDMTFDQVIKWPIKNVISQLSRRL